VRKSTSAHLMEDPPTSMPTARGDVVNLSHPL
jgi:hypothetical protein